MVAEKGLMVKKEVLEKLSELLIYQSNKRKAKVIGIWSWSVIDYRILSLPGRRERKKSCDECVISAQKRPV